MLPHALKGFTYNTQLIHPCELVHIVFLFLVYSDIRLCIMDFASRCVWPFSSISTLSLFSLLLGNKGKKKKFLSSYLFFLLEELVLKLIDIFFPSFSWWGNFSFEFFLFKRKFLFSRFSLVSISNLFLLPFSSLIFLSATLLAFASFFLSTPPRDERRSPRYYIDHII